MINIWQTIELLSRNDIKQYINGYSKDVQQFLENLKKQKNFNVEKNEIKSSNYNLNEKRCNINDKNVKFLNKNDKHSEKLSYPKQKKKNTKKKISYVYDNNEYLECSVNVSQLNDKFQRLMGTNVIRLTDRKYMKELQQRINEEYNQMLKKRIAAREQKEIERERNLIMAGKLKIIPDQLSSNHIAFILNENGGEFKSRRKTRLKTAHEINTERLKRLQSKWEKEFNENKNKSTYEEEQINLDYECETEVEENSINGKNDKKFDTANENLCSQDLEQKSDEAKSPISDKQSSVSSNPIESNGNERDIVFDIGNIVLARQKFRNTERKYQKELSEKLTKNGIKFNIIKDVLTMASLKSSNNRKIIENEIKNSTEMEKQKYENITIVDDEKSLKKTDSQKSNQSNDKTEMNLVIYQKKKIAELKKANSVNELYGLAEEIILGDSSKD